MLTFKVILTGFFIFLSISLQAQNISNQGTEFWSVFPTHEPNNGLLAQLSVFITSSQASSGTLTAGSFSTTFNVSANSVTEIQIPRTGVYIDTTEGNQVLINRAIHILVDSGKPKVVVYTHIFAGQRSAATLILPKEALGQQYYSINYTQDDAGKNFITIVASEPETKIHIRNKTTELVPGGITLHNVNDLYEVLADSDLTGISVSVDTLTSGCKHFAVFSGSSGIRIAATSCTPLSIDPLFQQNYPITSWGMHYGFIPFSMKSPVFKDSVRTAGEFIRVLASINDTHVSINGSPVAVLNTGQYYTTPNPVSVSSFVSADQPVAVAQYALTQSCSNIVPNTGNQLVDYSDPDMVILNPVEYSIKNITMYSSTRQNIAEQYINVLISNAASSSFRINNVVPAEPFISLTGLPGYSFAQISLNGYNTNTFTLQANDGFNAVAYGFGDVESYSYSAGTNLAVTQSISGILRANTQAIDSACVNDDYYFKLRLPYKSPQLTWQMDANEAATTQVNPPFTIVNVRGQNYYEYAYPKTLAYQNAGIHQITVTAQYPVTLGGCGTGQQIISYAFKVNPLPAVAFGKTHEACSNVIDFKDLTVSNGSISGWLWNFGDGTTSALQNPVHAYADTGTYTVNLNVSLATGCQGFKADTVSVKQKVATYFVASGPNCVNSPVTLTDSSFIKGFPVASRRWYFGDGDSLIVTNSLTVQHVYKTDGNYLASLVLVNTSGCMSASYSRQIAVSSSLLPVPDFKLPAVCSSDKAAQFMDATTFPGNTKPVLTYLWNFGDSTATTANPNTSNLQNPTHYYSQAEAYQVSLTVTTTTGCSSTITKNFVVNGSSPTASFIVTNNGMICSKDSVLFQNVSTVNFGAVTRLEWYFDNVNAPNTVQVYLNPLPGQVYKHQYPPFTYPASKTYQVRLVAYSGTLCFADTIKTVILTAAPQVKFDSLGSVCIAVLPYQLKALETSGTPGSGTYYGAGVTADGTFSPVTAGPGNHVIKYVYTATSGCADSAMQQVNVTFKPFINAKGPYCAGSAVGFSDTSCVATLKNGTWKWDFGDGGSSSVNVPSVMHTYKSAGSYTISLVVVSSTGSVSSTAAININVDPIQSPDFSVPGICLYDQQAQFTNLTVPVTVSDAGLTYLWNFGDPNATTDNPDTSTLTNPVHLYKAAGRYQVSLTAITPGGCAYTIVKPFTVNGGKPVASFSIVNPGAICSSDAVIVQNNSSVDIGSITRIDWYFDNVNNPQIRETYTNPAPGQLYNHVYPSFHSPASINYSIRLVAYSGTHCVADTLQTITVLALPTIQLDTIGSVCVNAPAFRLTQGKEANGIAGTGIYSGSGVSADGTFSPAVAGTGIHPIQYKFINNAGCADSASRLITVTGEPTLSGLRDTTVLQGNSVTLNNGPVLPSLTYNWSPATGLSSINIASPVATPVADITYTVTVSNGGCQLTGQVHITVVNQLFIPNTFTPNGDGTNDTWNIRNLNLLYPNVVVEIYTRNGARIFRSVGYTKPWDGTYDGKKMPDSTY